MDGCEGQGQWNNDYCYIPPEGELVLKGNNGEPANAFPLQACEGDCDADWECDYGLVCAQRNDDVEIEGCTGRGAEGYDYCYVPPPNTLIRMGNNNDPPENFPLGVCEGDCDYDSDCSGE